MYPQACDVGSSPPTLRDGQIRRQARLENRVPERLALRDLAHQQLNQHAQLRRRLQEPRCDLGLGRAPDGLLEVAVGLGVVELDGPDPADVVAPPGELPVAGGRLGEPGPGDEPVRLVVQAVGDVVAEQEREERREEVDVAAEGSSPLGGEESAEWRIARRGLLSARGEEQTARSPSAQLTCEGEQCRLLRVRGRGPSRSKPLKRAGPSCAG